MQSAADLKGRQKVSIAVLCCIQAPGRVITLIHKEKNSKVKLCRAHVFHSRLIWVGQCLLWRSLHCHTSLVYTPGSGLDSPVLPPPLNLCPAVM